jgi:hypothetical protein
MEKCEWGLKLRANRIAHALFISDPDHIEDANVLAVNESMALASGWMFGKTYNIRVNQDIPYIGRDYDL